jgi:cytochrome c oxidase subunit 1
MFFPLLFPNFALPEALVSIESKAFMSAITGVSYVQQSEGLHMFMTVAAIITIASQALFVINLIWSYFKGQKASVNPWESTTLEWTVPSPPPHDNFAGVEPVVYRGPYEYSVPGASKDYLMQNEPDATPARS